VEPLEEYKKAHERHTRQALRTFERPPPALVKGFGERLVLECRFFGISWLEVDLLGIIGPHRLRPRDKSIQEREASGNTLVLDVFAERWEPKHPNELELPLLFCSGRRKVPELVASTNAARERLDEFSRGLLGKMGGVEGVFLAGGSVASLSHEAG
jgi:hypothetical protein